MRNIHAQGYEKGFGVDKRCNGVLQKIHVGPVEPHLRLKLAAREPKFDDMSYQHKQFHFSRLFR